MGKAGLNDILVVGQQLADGQAVAVKYKQLCEAWVAVGELQMEQQRAVGLPEAVAHCQPGLDKRLCAQRQASNRQGNHCVGLCLQQSYGACG